LDIAPGPVGYSLDLNDTVQHVRNKDPAGEFFSKGISLAIGVNLRNAIDATEYPGFYLFEIIRDNISGGVSVGSTTVLAADRNVVEVVIE
tara:strand:+ start:383 stop:652 length:270 start_codon:yes stop_codon:yes gene_type:complete